jgi:hypothetical protein
MDYSIIKVPQFRFGRKTIFCLFCTFFFCWTSGKASFGCPAVSLPAYEFGLPRGNSMYPVSEHDLILQWNALDIFGECQILIRDAFGILVYSSITTLESGQYIVSDPDQILKSGSTYSYQIWSKRNNHFPVVSESFTFWPECNQVVNIEAYKQLDDRVLVTWSDPDPSTPGTYLVRFSSNGKAEDVIEAGNLTSVYINSIGFEGQLAISVQKRCLYNNGISIVGKWTPGPTINIQKSHERVVDCSTLEFTFSCSNISDSSVVVNVNGPAAGNSSDGPWYRIRYRIKHTQAWDLVHLQSGSSVVVKGLSEGTTYDIFVQGAVGDEPYNPREECENMPAAQEFTTQGDTTWNDVHCGADPDTAFTSDDPNLYWGVGEVVFIRGFSLKAVSITHLGSGYYSGTGILGIPFPAKHIQVAFDSVLVNVNNDVEYGEVVMVNDPIKEDNKLLLLNQLPPAEFDCTPPQKDPYEFDETTGLNSFGFDSTGCYCIVPPYEGWEEGMPYDSLLDPDGFDANGIHFSTGSIYGPNGCSQAGLDSLGRKCDPSGPAPYYWVNQSHGDPTKEGQQFWHNHKLQIDSAIITAIENFWNDATDSIEEVSSRCEIIRTAMESIVTSEQLDPYFLFGDSLEYIEEGLHKRFAREPNQFSNFSGRDANIMNLEDKHFDLYHCDRYLHQFKEMEEMLDSILTLVSQEEFLPAFRSLIQPYILGLDSTEIAQKIGTPEKLRSFVANLVFKKLIEDYKLKYGYSFSQTTDFHLFNRFENPSLTWPRQFRLNNEFPSGVGCSVALPYENYLEFYSHDEITKFSESFGSRNEYLKVNAVVSGSEGEKGPIFLTKDIGSNSHTIFLENIRISPTEAKLDATFILEVQSGKPILFSAEDVGFNRGGLNASGKLILQNNVSISMGKAIRLNLIGDQENTFVAWGCDGIDSISIDAQIEFCREYVTPLDSVTLLPLSGNETVKVDLTAKFQSWDDFIVHINVPAFALTGKEDYKFVLTNTWLDFSDIENPENIIYPTHYTHERKGLPTWQGVYFQELSVTLPKFMAPKDSDELTLGLHNFVFDDKGASGRIALTPVLSLSNGTMGGWAFSIDSLDLEITHNRFAEGYMGGLVHVPLFRSTTANSDTIKPKDCFGYFANIDAFGNFMFKVTPKSAFTIPMVFAAVTLKPSTSIIMKKLNDEFEIIAFLHGDITIDTIYAGIPLRTGQITFENVVLANRGSVVRNIGYWNFPGFQVDFSGFNLNFERIGIRQSPTNAEAVELLFNTSLSLTEAQVDLNVKFNFGIEGSLDKTMPQHKWKYDNFNVYNAILSGSCPGIDYIYGELVMYQNKPTYGNGFQGAVAVKFSKMKLQIRAMGIFGRTAGEPSYKYGMVDALAMFPGDGIPIISPVNLNGIGGGFWYNMSTTGHETVQIVNSISPDSITTGFINNRVLGVSLSGVQYSPEEEDWGFKITACFVVANENAANGNATIGISFTEDKGVDKFFVEGNIQFMTGLNMAGLATYNDNDTIDPSSSGLCNGAPIRAFLQMQMDFTNNAFDADFQAFLSVDQAIRGAGPANSFCPVKIHVDSKDWYVWFGEPSRRAGIKVKFPGGIGNIDFTTYLNMGTKLPNPAELDAKLTKFFGVQPGYTPNHKFSTGQGFMHGSTFVIDAPEKKVWILTFSANLTVGYDLALTQYNATCKHNNLKPGFNGWYASGQLYAYMAVELGYRFKMFFKNYSGTIAGIQAGVLLRTQLPNPVWAQGVVKAKYNILGIFKGSAKFNVEFGEKCTLIGENGDEYVADLEIINYIDPGDGLSSVAVNVKPKVYFNYPLKTELLIEGSNGTPVKYEFKLIRLEWRDEMNRLVGYKEAWNESYTELTLVPNEFLQPNLQYNIKVIVAAYVNNILDQRDTLVVNWVTGGRPNIILAENVIESYPHVDQHYFLPGDRDAQHCYVKLASGQYYLFAERPSNALNVIRIKHLTTKETVYETKLHYDCSKSQLNWLVDWNTFVQPGTMYEIRCVQVRKPWIPDEEESNQEDGINMESDSREVGSIPGWPLPEPPNPGVPSCGQYENDLLDTLVEEFEFFKYTFTTSQYGTAEEKLTALLDSILPASSDQNEPYVYSIGGMEGFDDYEINGHNGLPPFFKMKIIKGETDWVDPFADFFSIRLPGMAIDCKGDTLLLSEEFQLVVDPFFESLVWNTGFNDTLVLNNNTYNDVELVNYLPSLIHNDFKSLDISFHDHIISHCWKQYSPNSSLLQLCQNLHFNCPFWNDISIRLMNNDYNVSVNSGTRIQIDYNCKPSTNKGMGSYYFNLSQ